MNYNIKTIIKNANAAYSDGKTYNMSNDELDIVNRILHLDLKETALVDSTYDIIYAEAKKQWPNDKFFKELQAENSGYGKEIIHSEPMGSMEELKEGDWDVWKVDHHSFLLTEKLDGCSIILTYQNGKLYSAATRGRGVKGKCIMRHIPFISNIPQTITNTDTLVVRGELLCPKDEIPTMLQEVAEIEGKEQKNGRNTIAGALNRKESNEVVFKHAHFVAYWDSINKGNALDELDEYGFETPWDLTIDDTTTEEELIEQVKEFLFISKYEIDGIILTQLDNPEEGLETGTINPKCSRKFKIGIYDNKAESKVLNITWQASKNAKLTPVLNIKPIELCGVTICNVTGSNYKNLFDKKCGIGSKIVVKRAGLVVPYLEEVLTPSEELNIPAYTYVSGADLYLSDISDEVAIRRLVYFGKKLGIDCLGEGNCKKVWDRYKEKPEALLIRNEAFWVALIGENGKKIYASIQKAKENLTECALAAACGAFGEGIGERILLPVYEKYETLDITAEQLNSVPGFDDIRISQYIKNKNTWLDIKNFVESFGIKFVHKQKNTALPLSEYVICFTGIRDKEFAKFLEDNGATVTESFNKSVNMLITKDTNSTSSKIIKARENGCEVITLEEAKERFK